MQAIPRAIGTRARACARKSLEMASRGIAAMLAAAGCTRAYYHDYADSDVYGILKERLFDWRWRVPERPVEAAPISRMADLNDPNHEPLVTDEVAARRFQVSSRFPFEYHGWKKRGTTPIEDLSWQPVRSARIRRQDLAEQGFDHADRHGQQPRIPVRV